MPKTPRAPSATRSPSIAASGQPVYITIKDQAYYGTGSFTDAKNIRVYKSIVVNAFLPGGMQQIPTALGSVIATNGSGTFFSYHFPTLTKIGSTGNMDFYEGELSGYIVVTPGMAMVLELDRTKGPPPAIAPSGTASGKFYLSGDTVTP
jgi:hypothetical protein